MVACAFTQSLLLHSVRLHMLWRCSGAVLALRGWQPPLPTWFGALPVQATASYVADMTLFLAELAP